MHLVSKGATVTTWTGVPTMDPTPWRQYGTEAYRSFSGFQSRTIGDFTQPAEYDMLVRLNPWVFEAVVLRSTHLARLPFKAYKRGVDGQREPDEGTLAKLLMRPHPQLSMKQIFMWAFETLAIHGRAYLWFRDRAMGQPVSLIPMHPSHVTQYDDGNYRLTFSDSKLDRDVKWRDMMPLVDNAGGISPLEPLRQALLADAAAVAAQAAHWRRGAMPGLILSHPGKISEAGTKNLMAQVEQRYSGPQNAGRAMLLQEGMTVSMLNFDASAAAYIESRKLTREEVAAAFRMPAPVLGILENATLANVKELYYALYRDVLAPIAVMTADAFNNRLIQGPQANGSMNFSDEPGDRYVEFGFEEVLRGTPEAQMESIAKQIQSGITTPNEARKALNRPSMEGGDRLLVNGALVPLTLAGAQVASQPEQLALGV
jgi:HK97 family phage portal protein